MVKREGKYSESETILVPSEIRLKYLKEVGYSKYFQEDCISLRFLSSVSLRHVQHTNRIPENNVTDERL